MSAALPPVALSLIGIGTGNPDHLTREAQAAMQAADLILLPHKGEDKAELAALRRDLCDAVLTAPGPRIEGFDMPVRRSVGDDYLAQVDEWHAAITRCWQAAITRSMANGLAPRTAGQPLQVALLVWGDPALYDSTLRILGLVRERGVALRLQVIPGISSVQALAARHQVPLNRIGEPLTVLPGRRLAGQGQIDNVLVMLDGQCAFARLDDPALMIYWGAYLGTADEVLIAGPLQAVKAQIMEVRERERARKGWIMDSYLLRREL